jgi:hypothetical protein
MLLDYTYQEVIHMKVSHLIVKEHELMSSRFVRYGIVFVHGGTDWVTSARLVVGMEWGSTAEEAGDFSR